MSGACARAAGRARARVGGSRWLAPVSISESSSGSRAPREPPPTTARYGRRGAASAPPSQLSSVASSSPAQRGVSGTPTSDACARCADANASQQYTSPSLPSAAPKPEGCAAGPPRGASSSG